jgi:chorismate dehydratase
MWDFEHPPIAATLAERYSLHYTLPSLCADELISARADLGLIPIASLTPDLAIVPNCVIASLDRVRSILLVVRSNSPDPAVALQSVRSIAADKASRSSLAYANILFRKFLSVEPNFVPCESDLVAMFQCADAAVLIGDPALNAIDIRQTIEQAIDPHSHFHWFDLAHEWRIRTGLPWVAAVWAVRPESLPRAHTTPTQLIEDLTQSRDHGLAHIEDLVQEWTPRLPLLPETIRHYLTHNIHYTLDPDCIRTIKLFRQYAAEIGALPPLPDLRFL